VTEALGLPDDTAVETKVVINPADHLGLVRTIAAKYTPRGTPIEDTDEYGEGVMGLLRAVEKYDPAQGPFSTVAWKSIQGAIIQSWRKKKRQKRTGVVVSFEENNNTDPIDSRLDLSNVDQVIASYFEPHPNDTENDLLAKKVLFEHFINEKTWAEIGRDLQVTREWARQLGKQALELIRTRFKISDFRTVEEMLDDI